MNEKASLTVRAADAKREKAFPPKRESEADTIHSARSEYILNLQRSIGNQAVQRLFESGIIQAKLEIGHPGDIYEQEADRVADQVMRMRVQESDNEINKSEISNPHSSIRLKPT